MMMINVDLCFVVMKLTALYSDWDFRCCQCIFDFRLHFKIAIIILSPCVRYYCKVFFYVVPFTDTTHYKAKRTMQTLQNKVPCNEVCFLAV